MCICTRRGKLRTLYYESANCERTAFTITKCLLIDCYERDGDLFRQRESVV